MTENKKKESHSLVTKKKSLSQAVVKGKDKIIMWLHFPYWMLPPLKSFRSNTITHIRK